MGIRLIHRVYWRAAEKSWRLILRQLGYSRFVPAGIRAAARKHFWNSRASWIHYRWGEGVSDYQIIERIIINHHIRSVLDLGCGSGRYFPLYARLSVDDVLGIDISKAALEIARSRFPRVKTICVGLEKMDLHDRFFDLGISNRTLQAIPKDMIGPIITHVCRQCTLVYVNEVTEADGLQESAGFYLHDYSQLFGTVGYQLMESGAMGDQRWTLWGQV